MKQVPVPLFPSNDSGNGSTNSENNSGSNSSNSGNNSGNSGGNGSVTPSVAKPTILGTSPFEETTSVSISGPAGAEIRYTVDGSAPSAQSTLYSEPFSLTDTTTVKAIAIKDGQSSQVASRQFSKGTAPEGGDTPGGDPGDVN